VTREEVLRLTGRELDAAVAERVMGWVGPVHWVCNEPFMAVPVYDRPHPDCRRTDMPVRPELIGQVLWCVCHMPHRGRAGGWRVRGEDGGGG